MPWDNDNDDDESVDWCSKYLETRIRFCFDLKRDMSRAMADHIRKLWAEARYIQSKHEIIEMEMSDDETLEEGITFNHWKLEISSISFPEMII